MAKIVTTAGVFELECYTNGHPLWVKLKINGEEVERTFITVDALHDLIHAAKRMIDKTAP